MNLLLENNNNGFLEKFLGVENLYFSEDICDDRKIYFGEHIKRGGDYRKKDEIPYTFPRYISCFFTKNGNRMGLKFKTEDFIVSYDYKYEKMDTVDMGDGLIAMEKPIFREKRPLLLPYLFIGNGYKIDVNKIAEYLHKAIGNFKANQ